MTHRAKLFLSATLPLLTLTALGAAGLYGRYGGGATYPDLTGPPLFRADAMTEAARYDEPIGNVAVSADGRLFFSVHPESRPDTIKVLEWKDGKAVPYPSLKAQAQFETVLGMAIDQRQRLWTIDHGNHGTGKAQLIGFDLNTNKIVKRHAFSSEVAPVGSFLQDVNVSPDGRWAYIADVSFWRKSPGLVVVDLQSGKSRRVLDGHHSVMPQDYVIRNPIKDMVFFGGLVALKAGVDGIAVSPDGQWVAFGAMAHNTMYKIKTSALQDWSLSDDVLAAQLVHVGKKPLSDGISIDRQNNILITDVEHSAIVRQRPNGQLQTIIRDTRIRWADSLSHGPNKSLYLADSAIPHQMLQSKAHIRANAPYFIWKVEMDIDGAPGQ